MIPLMSRAAPVQVDAPSFDGQAAQVMAQLQAALTELFTSVDEPITRAVDVERAFRLDKTLSWQIFRLSQSADLAEAANVPARTSVRRLLDAAKRRRVPKSVLERVSVAFEHFESFTAIHGGDRAGLMSMVSGLTGVAGGSSQQYDLRVRKSLFRGNAHMWGVQARMAIRTGIFVPRPGTDRVEDIAMVIGDIDLVRRRQTDPLTMLWWLKTEDLPSEVQQPDSAGSAPHTDNNQPPVDHALEILAEFSSKPLPRMVRNQDEGALGETELIVPAGNAGATTVYSMHRREGVSSHPGTSFFGQTLCTMPLETMVWQILIPVGWSNPSSARAAVYGRRHHPEQVFNQRTADLMAQRETFDYLGVHEGVPPLTGDPTHPAVVRHVIELAGWGGLRFDVYRCRVQYPMMHTLLVTRVDAIKR
jgi:hypothetical protein